MDMGMDIQVPKDGVKIRPRPPKTVRKSAMTMGLKGLTAEPTDKSASIAPATEPKSVEIITKPAPTAKQMKNSVVIIPPPYFKINFYKISYYYFTIKPLTL